jgi:uncharacterized alpha-E superfamily protein
MTALRMEDAYRKRHDAVEPDAVFQFVSLDRDYDGSIFSCLRAARENARAVRGSLTSELWETLNSTWLELRSVAARRSPARRRLLRRVGRSARTSRAASSSAP